MGRKAKEREENIYVFENTFDFTKGFFKLTYA